VARCACRRRAASEREPCVGAWVARTSRVLLAGVQILPSRSWGRWRCGSEFRRPFLHSGRRRLHRALPPGRLLSATPAARRCCSAPPAVARRLRGQSWCPTVDNIHVAAPQPGARSRMAPADTGPSARLAAVGLSTLAFALICSLSTRPGTSHLAGAATSVGDVELCGGALVRRASFPLAVGADQRDKGPELVGWFCFVSAHMKPKIVLFLWDPGAGRAPTA
jgi:hypothetical protein